MPTPEAHAETRAPAGGWAWAYFVAFTVRRLGRARMMVGTSLALLGLVALLVHLNTRFDRWGMHQWHSTIKPGDLAPSTNTVFTNNARDSKAKSIRLRNDEIARAHDAIASLGFEPSPAAGTSAVTGAVRAALREGASLRVFTASIVLGLLASFLLPLWTLTFATESLGRLRENRTLTWILLRPLSRTGIYLGGYLAALPWCLALNLGGFATFCLLAGDPGRRALSLYGPGLALGTFAFAAFFQFLSVTFRRPGVIGLLYAFFFETIVSNLPGQQKYLCISYYVRCAMRQAAEDAGVTLLMPGVRPWVSGTTASIALVAIATAFLALGLVVFNRREYVDASGQ